MGVLKMRSVWFRRSLLLSFVAMFTVVACGGGGTQNAGSVKVMATWTGDEQASFFAVMKPFTDSTGIKIEYEASRDQDALLTTRVAAGNPPDLAAAPSPTLLTNWDSSGTTRRTSRPRATAFPRRGTRSPACRAPSRQAAQRRGASASRAAPRPAGRAATG